MAISAELKELWEKVKANQARLRACEGPHDFEPDPEDTRHKDERMKNQCCKKCGGVMDAVNTAYYNDGVAHGRKAQQEGR